MNCFNHHERSAVTQCRKCNKGLCNDCAKQYSTPICSTCNSARARSEKSQALEELFLTFGIGLVLTFILPKVATNHMPSGINSTQTNLKFFTMFYAYSGLVAGWYTLKGISPRTFLLLPFFGMFIYFIIKIMLSLCIGVIMLPIRTTVNITKLR